MPLVENRILALGILAPAGYVVTGILGTVIAPFGLGPVNVILQRAFGFWPSVGYFWLYEVIGLSINFLLSKQFGHRIVSLFTGDGGQDDGQYENPFLKFQNRMLTQSHFSAFAIMLGLGGEILAYLAGLSQLKFRTFLVIISITTAINAPLIVGGNLTIGTNNQAYIAIQVLAVGLTLVPLGIVMRKEISSGWNRLKQWWNTVVSHQQEYDTIMKGFQSNTLSEKEFTQRFLQWFSVELQLSAQLSFPEPNPDQEKVQKYIEKERTQILQKLNNKLGYIPKDIPEETEKITSEFSLHTTT